MLENKLRRTLFIALLALSACGSESTQQAVKETAEAAQAVKKAVQEQSAATAESIQAAAASAKSKVSAAKQSFKSSQAAAKQEIKAIASTVVRFAVETKEELDQALGSELIRLDEKKAKLDTDLAAASEEVRTRISFFAAVADAKRELFEFKAVKFKNAGEQTWLGMQPGLESSLASIEAAIDDASARFKQVLSEQDPSGPAADWQPTPPRELYEVVKVVDGDTIHIMRNGKKEKLRLLSVDTEEKLSGRPYSESKPETLFGEDTKLWAIDLFAGIQDEDGVSRVGLLFPDGEEQYDIYGRLLCQVILPDGTDFNLQLVKEGRSPYFMKYGYSKICHAAFEAAEKAARAAQLGIWNPEVNKPAAESEPWHKRNYAEIIPWWRARADGIEAFRQQLKASPDSVVAADDEPALEAALKRCEITGYLVSVFGSIDRTFEENDGSLTLLFRAPKGQTAFRARISKEVRPHYEALDLENRNEPLRQNYLFAVGMLESGQRGFNLAITDSHSLRLAAPDPLIAK